MIKQLLSTLAVAIILAVIGLLSVWAQQPWLVPSLGSAVFIQLLTPQEPSARVWHMAVGQIVGVVGGFAGVYLASAAAAPSFNPHHELFLVRVLATGLATLVTAALQFAFKAINPAGGATAVVVAVGAESASWAGAARLVLAILLVTMLGEATRRRLILRIKILP